jgi:hypothetical protein
MAFDDSFSTGLRKSDQKNMAGNHRVCIIDNQITPVSLSQMRNFAQ